MWPFMVFRKYILRIKPSHPVIVVSGAVEGHVGGFVFAGGEAVGVFGGIGVGDRGSAFAVGVVGVCYGFVAGIVGEYTWGIVGEYTWGLMGIGWIVVVVWGFRPLFVRVQGGDEATEMVTIKKIGGTAVLENHCCGCLLSPSLKSLPYRFSICKCFYYFFYFPFGKLRLYLTVFKMTVTGQ